jgi:hypothetical protein
MSTASVIAHIRSEIAALEKAKGPLEAALRLLITGEATALPKRRGRPSGTSPGNGLANATSEAETARPGFMSS